jgi:hypothetical protein
MTTIQLDAPEYRALADVIRHGDAVEFVDHGEVIARLPPRGQVLAARLTAFRQALGAPRVMADSVEAMRREDIR